MKWQWQPTQHDLDWTRGVFNILKPDGVWGCPAGFSMWIKTGKTSCRFMGPLHDDDELPTEVPSDIAKEAIASCLLTNRRIVRCLEVIGYSVVNVAGETIILDPDWDLTDRE